MEETFFLQPTEREPVVSENDLKEGAYLEDEYPAVQITDCTKYINGDFYASPLTPLKNESWDLVLRNTPQVFFDTDIFVELGIYSTLTYQFNKIMESRELFTIHNKISPHSIYRLINYNELLLNYSNNTLKITKKLNALLPQTFLQRYEPSPVPSPMKFQP